MSTASLTGGAAAGEAPGLTSEACAASVVSGRRWVEISGSATLSLFRSLSGSVVLRLGRANVVSIIDQQQSAVRAAVGSTDSESNPTGIYCNFWGTFWTQSIAGDSTSGRDQTCIRPGCYSMQPLHVSDCAEQNGIRACDIPYLDHILSTDSL